MKPGDFVVVIDGKHRYRKGRVHYVDARAGRVYITGDGMLFSVKTDFVRLAEAK